MSILVVGSMALDTIKTPAGEAPEIIGGSATHFALGARFFTGVRLMSTVGKDFPERYLDELTKRGIDVSGVHRADGRTFRWTGSYEGDMNAAKTLSVSLNVMGTYVPRVPAAFKNSPYVFLANIGPEVQEAVLRQVSRPKLVVCDTMNLWIATKLPALKRLLKQVDILVLNDGEARMLSRERNLVAAARDLLRLGPKAVIVKKGEHGLLLAHGKTIFPLPAYPLAKVTDPTGAGDSFGGGFTGWLAETGSLSSKNLRMAAAYGTVVASFTVEDFGTRRIEAISRKDVVRRFNAFRNLVDF